MVLVTAARHLGGFQLWLEFNDGAAGEVDLESELWGEMFEPLRDPLVFARARFDPELDTVVWPNGADFAPEFFRDRISQRSAEQGEASR